MIPFQRRSKNEMELLESIAFGICLFAFGDIQMQQKIISASADMKMRRESLELVQWWKIILEPHDATEYSKAKR